MLIETQDLLIKFLFSCNFRELEEPYIFYNYTLRQTGKSQRCSKI